MCACTSVCTSELTFYFWISNVAGAGEVVVERQLLPTSTSSGRISEFFSQPLSKIISQQMPKKKEERRRRRKKKNETKDVLVWIWRFRFNSLPARRDSTSPPPTCWRTFQFHHFVPNLQSSTDEEELNSISSNETRWIELNQFFLTITLLEALSPFSITLSLPLSILSIFSLCQSTFFLLIL